MYKQLLRFVVIFAVYGCSNPFNSDNDKNIGPIIFTSNKDGQEQIYSMKEDGTNIVKVTHSNFRNFMPRWSRDGQSIVFNSKRSNHIHFRALVMADASGSNERVLFDHGLWPVFSPSGDRIAFSYDTVLPGFGSNYDILIYDIQSRSAAPFKEDTSFSEIVTDWSLDGQYLLVESYKGTTNTKLVSNINLIKLADSSRTQLTEWPRLSYSGRFSPEGTSIAYINQDSSSTVTRNIYIMNLDGTGKRVVENQMIDTQMHRVINIAWSPNGSKIVFILNDRMNSTDGSLIYNVYSINIDGTGITKLTTDADKIDGLGIDWRW